MATISPVYADMAKRRHWIVRWLRYTAFFEVAALTVVGVIMSRQYASILVYDFYGEHSALAETLAVALGGFLSFVAALGVTLPTWALALVIDDLHALRLNSQGYTIQDGARK